MLNLPLINFLINKTNRVLETAKQDNVKVARVVNLKFVISNLKFEICN